MASHVIVVDSSARTFRVKTSPDKPVYEIRDEACAKFGRDASRYVLKHKDKELDHARRLRLSGLVGGARLDLLLSSRSPSAISVALQLPEAEPDGTSRLTEKFSSDTSIWLILRYFESQASSKRNFTARGTPVINNDNDGAGRLYYETPIVQAEGRELSSFTDLQKSPASIGVNKGSILLRLRFHQTDRPLEAAIGEITQYFESVDKAKSSTAYAEDTDHQAMSRKINEIDHDDATKFSAPDASSATAVRFREPEPLSQSNGMSSDSSSTAKTRLTSDSDQSEFLNGPDQRPISVFAPPSSSTPQAVQHVFSEADFVPTLDHVRSHQKSLENGSRNQRLATDAELAAQAQAQVDKAAMIKDVQIKVRFPDESQVSATFTTVDTTHTLYRHVKGLMQRPEQPFHLNYRTAKGPKVIREDSNDRLIGDIGMAGRILVNVLWEPGVSEDARKEHSLKEEYRLKAQAIQIPKPEYTDASTHANDSLEDVKSEDQDKGKRRDGVPKWLKLPGKK